MILTQVEKNKLTIIEGEIMHDKNEIVFGYIRTMSGGDN